jgi:hypothetical protein
MTKYLISFPGSAMQLDESEFEAAGRDAHAVIQEMKDAGASVFGGGIDEDVVSVMVAADGTTTHETYPQTTEFDGGFCVIEAATRDEALMWATKLAAACRCSQELRQFMDDPES